MTLRQISSLEELDFQRLDKVHSRDMLSFNGNAYMSENNPSLDATFLGPSSEAEESEEAAAAAAAFDVVLESAVRGLEGRVTQHPVSTKTTASVPSQEMPPTQAEPTPSTAEALFGYQTHKQAACSSAVVAPSHAEPRVDAGSSPPMPQTYGSSTGSGSSHAHPRVSSASSMPQQAASAMATQSAVSSAMRAAFHPGGIGAATAQTAFGGASGLTLGPAGAAMLPAFFPPGVFPGLDMISAQRLASDPTMFQHVMQTLSAPGVPGGLASRTLTSTEQLMASRQLQQGLVLAQQQAAKPPQDAPFLVPHSTTAAATHTTDSGATSSRSPRVQGAHTAAAAAAAAASQLMHAEAEACSLARGGACKPGAINRKPWSRQEDDAIRALVSKLGQRWRVIAPHLAGRSDDSVRNRWKRISEEGDENSGSVATSDAGLTHDLPRGPIKPPTKQSTASSSASAGTGESGRASWSRTEDQVIVRAVQELGPRWSAVAARLPSRTEQAVRNRWNRLQQRARVGARQAALSAQHQATYM